MSDPRGGAEQGRVFLGDSEMAERVRAHEGAATPLRPLDVWQQSLKAVVDLLLANSFGPGAGAARPDGRRKTRFLRRSQCYATRLDEGLSAATAGWAVKFD